MNTILRLRSGAALAAGVTAVVLFHCSAAFAQSEMGPEERASLQPARVATPMALPDSVVEHAASYRFYMRSAGAIAPTFADGASIARSVRLGASYEPKQLARGAVAYAAVAALQDAEFVHGVRAAAARTDRETFISTLLSEPHRATVFVGAPGAMGRISAALRVEGAYVRTAGLRVKQAAYDVQKQGWSKAEVSGRVERLAEAKTLSLSSLSAPETAFKELASFTAEPAQDVRRTTVIDRGLALAALAVVGAADDASAQTLMTDPECASCLRMSKLNLFQCLAVAKPWYEDVFCLGQHVLIDTGECIYASSGARGAPVPTLTVAQPVRTEEEEPVTRIALR
jgi:hypothetical protein